MGTFYIISTPAGDPDDLTLRAQRILEEVVLVTSDSPGMQDLLAYHDITAPLLPLPHVAEPATTNHILDALDRGDVGLLPAGASIGLTGPSLAIVRAALERNHPVVPLPGPSLPLTALIASGLPAEGFVYLGRLPQEPNIRHDLLASVAAERCTLVALGSRKHLPELYQVLGDRPLAVVASGQGCLGAWRGTISQALDNPTSLPVVEPCVLVIGGSQEKPNLWDRNRLRAEIESCLDKGLGAKETSRRLATESGWPRREIYQLAVEVGQFRSPD